MTHKEAIHILDGFDLRNNADKYGLEALDMACDALEKQISHKDSWHKYPDEKPNLVDRDFAYSGNYIVTVLTGNKRETLEAGYERIMKRGKREERWVSHGRILSWPVLAWRELPEPWEGE